MKMTKREFKIWLLQHGYTQKTLADRLGMSHVTISGYNKIERYPLTFIMSLKYIETEEGEQYV